MGAWWIVAVSKEVYLISSILREEDMKIALQRGINPSQFHAYPEEWEWLSNYYLKHKKIPSKLAFKAQFPDFAIKAVNDTQHFSDEVRIDHSRFMLTSALRDVTDLIASGDIDSAVKLMSSKIVSISATVGDTSNDSDIIRNYQDTFQEVSDRVDRVAELGAAGIPTGFETLDERTGGAQAGHIWIVAARLGQGKMIDNDEPVLTPKGWKRNGDLIVGDEVIGSDGTPTKILAVYPHKNKQIYDVTFTDGTVIKCGDEHLWTLRIGSKPYKVWTTVQVMDWLKKGNQQPAVPTLSNPVTFNGSEKRMQKLYEPYLLGLLLGDGCFVGRGVQFTTADPELVKGWGRNAVKWAGKYDYGISRLKPTITKLGLWDKHSWDKFIPSEYKIAPPRYRHAILQGLFDTDGSATHTGGVEYTTTSKQLADDVRELAESLGGYASMNARVTSYTHKGEKKNGRISYRMIVVLPPDFPPFRLKRKLKIWKPRTKYQPSRQIVSVIKTKKFSDMTCITVDAPDSLYATRGAILTHNSWTMMRMATTACMAGYSVQYDALEMTRTEVSMRIHTFLSGAVGKELFKNLDLAQGRNFDLGAYREFLHSMKKSIKGKFNVSDSSRGKVSTLTVAAQIERNKPDIVFIDYLTLMEQSGNDWQAVAKLSGELKNLAMQYKVPIVAASQINRSGASGKEPPGAEFLSQSDAIGQDADVVITMQQQTRSVIQMKAVKNRHGHAGFKWYTEFKPGEGVFREVTRSKAEAIKDTDADFDDQEDDR